jgi:hypothetical protein
MGRSSVKRTGRSPGGAGGSGSGAAGGRGRARTGRRKPSLAERGRDDLFAELISDEDAEGRRARRRGLKEPDAIFWDFWN